MIVDSNFEHAKALATHIVIYFTLSAILYFISGVSHMLAFRLETNLEKRLMDLWISFRF